MTEKSAVITMRLSRQELERIEALRALVDVDRTTLLKDFINDGLRRRVVQIYEKGKLTAFKAAEILNISLREFLEVLEKEGIPINWDWDSTREYLETKYGE